MKTKEIEIPIKQSTVMYVSGLVDRCISLTLDIAIILVKVAVMGGILAGCGWVLGFIIILLLNPSMHLPLDGFDGFIMIAINPISLVFESILFIVESINILRDENVIAFRLIEDEVKEL